jgi:hypothetical protein
MVGAWPRPRRSRLRPVGLLIVHVVVTTLVFISIVTVDWLGSLFFSYLNSIHQFPPQVYRLGAHAEVWIFYVDCVLSSIVLAGSLVQFVWDIVEGGDS